jgi:glyoxylase-like metal-dependent hydrolase (beta-lactamase superfamily II)
VDNILEVFYPGAGHTKDNVVVWIPSAKVVFGGCLIRSLNSRGLGNLSDAYPEEWGKSALAVKETYPDSLIVVPGHGKRGDRSLIDHTINLTIEIQP